MIKSVVEPPFDTSLANAQSTLGIERLPVEQFDLAAYAEYDAELMPRAKAFWEAEEGVAVYRQFRAWPVFSTSANDKQASLEYQLECLRQSMDYKIDIPNFIEPWTGIGTVAAAWNDGDFIWKENQAPVLEKKFSNLEEALACDPMEVKDSKVGKFTLEMIDYFLEQTQGKIPMSVTDSSSPLNHASGMMSIETFFLEMIDNPEGCAVLMDRIADREIEFEVLQRRIIGDVLVKPGHGFCSSREFEGVGMSDDNFIMVSDDIYEEVAMPSYAKVGAAFGGPVLHSCGDWSQKVELAKRIPNILRFDGAFTYLTDPIRNPVEPFAEAMPGSGVTLQMRCVGDSDLVVDKVRQVWQPGLKLVVVTYCRTPEQQEECYDRIHKLCS